MKPNSENPRFNPSLFFTALVVPGMLSTLFIIIAADFPALGGVALGVLLLGSIIAGAICSRHFTSTRPANGPGSRAATGFFMFIGCTLASFAIGFGGCFLIATTL